MNFKIKLLGVIICAFFVFSCKKNELPIPAHQAGNMITATVNMDMDYKWQIYYDLKTNTVVGQNAKTAWDLGFETSENGYRVILNSSKSMYIFKTNCKELHAVNDTIGFANGKAFDNPNGSLDSTAIGNWQTATNVYIIDRGFSENGFHQGFRKILFQNVNATSYTVRFAELNGTKETTLTIPKDSAYNFSFLSFASSSVVSIEPPKATWDLVFTQYLESLSSPYLVTGCIMNRYNTFAKMDSLTSLNNITHLFAQSQKLSSNINTIGYSWKSFNLSTSTYTVYPYMNYIIKDSDGFLYKLHFIDFYNNLGIKGSPKFEFQEL